jgi:hypothetical protein
LLDSEIDGLSKLLSHFAPKALDDFGVYVFQLRSLLLDGEQV